ncbi:hypothetical protein V1517DRAFT_309028 [Lipomyces orientalis]|uniref:Uncharacterized protein n=1 Tax=Lipomyces orientalis TaxID=1233043 RepID=A0ACC3TK67_9ASCO
MNMIATTKAPPILPTTDAITVVRVDDDEDDDVVDDDDDEDDDDDDDDDVDDDDIEVEIGTALIVADVDDEINLVDVNSDDRDVDANVKVEVDRNFDDEAADVDDLSNEDNDRDPLALALPILVVVLEADAILALPLDLLDAMVVLVDLPDAAIVLVDELRATTVLSTDADNDADTDKDCRVVLESVALADNKEPTCEAGKLCELRLSVVRMDDTRLESAGLTDCRVDDWNGTVDNADAISCRRFEVSKVVLFASLSSCLTHRQILFIVIGYPNYERDTE